MRLNYFLLISRDDKVSHEITTSFTQAYDLNNIMEMFAQAGSFELNIDGYDVMLEIFEVESSFIKMMQSLGGVPGVVWLENAELDLLIWEELKNVVASAKCYKNDIENYNPVDDDIVDYIGLASDGELMISFQDDTMSFEEVADFVDDGNVC